MFQTPAPRGGVPLSGRCHQHVRPVQGFKPLRLGAVFLCRLQQRRRLSQDLVSNPCASGRCSSVFRRTTFMLFLTLFQTPAPRGGVPLMATNFIGNPGLIRFKPLRLGAVFLWNNLRRS